MRKVLREAKILCLSFIFGLPLTIFLNFLDFFTEVSTSKPYYARGEEITREIFLVRYFILSIFIPYIITVLIRLVPIMNSLMFLNEHGKDTESKLDRIIIKFLNKVIFYFSHYSRIINSKIVDLKQLSNLPEGITALNIISPNSFGQIASTNEVNTTPVAKVGAKILETHSDRPLPKRKPPEQIKIVCPNCKTDLTIDSRYMGMHGTCKFCQSAIQVPTFEQWDLTQPSLFDDELKGLNGWLIIIGLRVLITPFTLLYPTYQVATFFILNSRKEILDNLTNPSSEDYHVLWAPMLIAEATIGFLLSAFGIFLIYLYFAKKKIFIGMFIAAEAFFVLFSLVDMCLLYIIVQENVIDNSTIASLIGSFLCVFYIILSIRVKNTFIN